MSPATTQILLTIVGLISGAGLTQLLTINAQRRRITGEGAVSEANAAKTYHEMSMDIFRATQEEAEKLRGKVAAMATEVERLRVQLHQMSDQIEEKDRIIESYRRGRP